MFLGLILPFASDTYQPTKKKCFWVPVVWFVGLVSPGSPGKTIVFVLLLGPGGVFHVGAGSVR